MSVINSICHGETPESYWEWDINGNRIAVTYGEYSLNGKKIKVTKRDSDRIIMKFEYAE